MNANNMMLMLQRYIAYHPHFAEDTLKTIDNCNKMMKAYNSAMGYKYFLSTLEKNPDTKDFAAKFSKDFRPSTFQKGWCPPEEMREISFAATSVLRGILEKPSDMNFFFSTLTPSDHEKMKQVIQDTLYERKKMRSKMYMKNASDLPPPIPMFDVDNYDHMLYLFSVMCKCALYGTKMKTLGRVIFEAFDAVASKEAYYTYMERLEEFKKGNNPTFEKEIVRLGYLYALQWVNQYGTENHNLSDVVEYLQGNKILRTSIALLALSYTYDYNIEFYNTCVATARMSNRGITLKPDKILSYLRLLEKFLQMFQYDLMSSNPNMASGSRMILLATDIIAYSLQAGSVYSSWFQMVNTDIWWEGSYKF